MVADAFQRGAGVRLGVQHAGAQPQQLPRLQGVGIDYVKVDARHLRGVQLLLAGEDAAALEQFLEMLRVDRSFQDGLPRKALIDAFNVITDPALVSQYRRKMAALLF